MTLGLVAGVCALAVGAASATAHQFTASAVGKTLSEAEPGKTKGSSVGEQEFKFGAVHVTCESASTKGLVIAATSPTLKVVAKYTRCKTAIKVGAEPATLKTKFTAPVEYQFHANGFGETGTEGEEGSVDIGKGSAELKVSGIKCLVSWPAQTVPLKAEKKPEGEYTAAVYSNENVPSENLKKFPSGLQQKLVIGVAFKGMEFSLEEGQCEEFAKTEGKSAQYNGILRQELTGGNLGFE
jgi:hypothetical protein